MTVAAICIVCTVGAARWQPYKPMAQPKPTIEKPIKDQARMEIGRG